jgi:hypothetical protein
LVGDVVSDIDELITRINSGKHRRDSHYWKEIKHSIFLPKGMFHIWNCPYCDNRITVPFRYENDSPSFEELLFLVPCKKCKRCFHEKIPDILEEKAEAFIEYKER